MAVKSLVSRLPFKYARLNPDGEKAFVVRYSMHLQNVSIVEGTRWRETRRIRTGGGREAGGDGAQCGSHARRETGEKSSFLMTF